MGVPLVSCLLLMGAGVAFLLLPLQAGHRSCGGNAVTVRFQEEEDTRHSHECHAKALEHLVFGSVVAVAGAGLGTFSAAWLLPRHP